MLHSSANRAFTLVEMLVVIGIIGLLTGLVVPSLSGVRATAMNTRCLNNLRNDFVPITSWMQAHRGQLPMAEFLPAASDAGPQGGLPALLDGYLPKDSDTWRCPSDHDDDSLATGTSYLYMPGLLRWTPNVQFDVVQLLLALAPDTSDRERDRIRTEAESRLVLNFLERDTSGAFGLLIDSQDRHTHGTRQPRNIVFLDGTAREAVVSGESGDNEAVD
ncbi:MAG: prepilin-type N-terminal cleavage/methylation domain-containing protein [Phycisphaerales bacterium]|nr:prepilin-type N-terminal cleavage/methylation domain-containing protein [Phycisphaerales bacterium]